MKYQPQFDGFRGLCVSLVFVFHAQFLDCGWVGVQAFFVLSGFLITGVLLEAKEAGRRDFFRNFYARRSLRIFPVYLAYLGLVVLAGLANVGGPQMGELVRAHNAEHLPYLLTYTYNFFRINGGPGSPLYGHLWSLSIEEQFYLLWPLCVFFFARGGLSRLCLLLVLLGPAIRYLELLLVHPSRGDPAHAVYFLTSSHLDAFAFGALLHFRRDYPLVERIAAMPMRKLLLPVILLSSLLLLLARRAHLGMSLSSFGWPIYLPNFLATVWGYSLLNLVFFVAIANSHRLALLQGRAIQRLGKVSYGFYLFHLPIIWIAAQLTHIDRGVFDLANLVVNLAAFAATWLLAELSYRLLEAPLLRLKRRFGARTGPELEAPDQRGVGRARDDWGILRKVLFGEFTKRD